MTETLLITEKINDVKEEMRRTGIWKNVTPAWVKEFAERRVNNSEEFSEWLQFIFLPNRMQEAESSHFVIEKKYIVPQALQFFSSDIKKGKLLQLLIELDSLS